MHLRIPVMTAAILAVISLPAMCHDGPDPIAHWDFSQAQSTGQQIKSMRGPAVTVAGPMRWARDDFGESMAIGPRVRCVVADDYKQLADLLPRESFTVSCWVAVDVPQKWGGVIGTIEDDGDAERGWLLGHDEQVFTLILSTTGADDGNGQHTILRGTTAFEKGRLYHVAAVYDGKTAELYVNGEREGLTAEQDGPILYPTAAPFVIGGFKDRDADVRLSGRIREIKLFDLAAKPAWVRQEFEHHHQLAQLEASPTKSVNGFVVDPYLQFGTQTSMTVMWRTKLPGTTIVHYGETAECGQKVVLDGTTEIHEVKLDGLKPETQYFYLVESLLEDGSLAESDACTFSTAVLQETPFAFAVFGDTQANPVVSARLAEMAWGQRPSFLVHVGDLVDKGTEPAHWTEHFFPGMKPLAQRVPFYPVLGNHEQNSKNYFDYMSLPNPEYYYTFNYGNTQFFMIDSNRNIEPGSEQYEWLKGELEKSKAVWKIAAHHHPPYSSDENDYGDLWKVNQSTRGDLRARQLATLYDQFGVDIVWNGHIHSYERTWPVKAGRAVEKDGTTYMITGGAGGGLENAGPSRPFFQNNVKHGHHYCMVHINGGILELRSFDLEGRLFDTVRLEKAK